LVGSFFTGIYIIFDLHASQFDVGPSLKKNVCLPVRIFGYSFSQLHSHTYVARVPFHCAPSHLTDIFLNLDQLHLGSVFGLGQVDDEVSM
jgi:hypothetical protein